jgi:hypothetical protein
MKSAQTKLGDDWLHTAAMALDRAPDRARSYDADGRLHVALAHISKACVNDYGAAEIPGWEAIGLQRGRTYRLFRDPDELAGAAATFNNLPLLSRHVAVNAADHRPDLVIGCTGSDAEFVFPYLTNSVVIWSGADIGKIESGQKCQLSAAYVYTPDMTAGSFQGEPYDGVMRNLRGSHLALVTEGRVGGDVTL